MAIDPKEVTILQIGSTPARFAALSAQAPSTLLWSGFRSPRSPKPRVISKLFDLKDMFPEWPYETFAAQRIVVG